MHPRLQFRGHESVVDKKVFVHAELGVAPLEISGAIALHAMTQDEVLRAGRSPR